MGNEVICIMLVEDQQEVRMAAISMLHREGYVVIEAINGRDALEKYKTHSGKIDLLLTDIIMPEMGGFDLYMELKKINPAIKAAFMSGYAPDTIINSIISEEELPFLSKPFNRQELIQVVQQGLNWKK